METEKLIYDVFIGYHGTFDSNGSYAKAKLIADFLKASGYEVYLHGHAYCQRYPSHKDTEWSATWERISESRTFLLVVNDGVPKKGNGALGNDNNRVSQLRDELDTFNSLVQSGRRNKHDFNWFYVGNIEDVTRQQAFLSNLFKPLTNGHNCLLYGVPDYNQVKAWVASRLENNDSFRPAADDRYHTDFQAPDLTLISAGSFADAYDQACHQSETVRHNLLVRISLTADDFVGAFPFADALPKAKIIRANAPADDDGSNAQFSLYHGDYIILHQDGRELNGYDHVIKELKQKHSSRRALISLISTQHIVDSGNKPIPSYMLSQFQLCGDTLYGTEYYRSMEIRNYFPVNLGEAYLLIKDIIFAIPDIKKVVLLFHFFEAFNSASPVLSLYIPIMDRPNADLEIIPAIKTKDTAKLIELLEDKAFSKIYHIPDGFETMVRCARRFKTFGEDVTALLNALLAESQQLADISAKSNEPQPRLIESIDRNVKALIALLRA